MKRFIILTTTIRNMGGAQMYAANKLLYFEHLGWKPEIYFHNEGPVKIGYFKQFEGNLIPELLRPFIEFGKQEREQIAHRILGDFKESDEILLECHTPELAYWGEYLAKKCNGKNTIYLLEEAFPRFTAREVDFYEFKFDRKELLNSVEESLRRIFTNRYDETKHGGDKYHIRAYCENVIDYTPIQLPVEVKEADHSIISIGRLDKPYIKPMLDEILKFTGEHKDKIFNLIVVGGDWENKMNDYIRDLFSTRENVRLFLLGYIFPIPYDWVKISDVSIASSNSILVSANEGVPTNGIDIHDYQPIGVYKHTTDNLWSRENEPQTPLGEWLEEVLIKGKYPKKLIEHSLVDDLGEHLKPHLDKINDSAKSKEYFDVENMYSVGERLVYKVKKILRPLYKRIRTNNKKV